jgi:hypothetical protein
MQMQVGNIKQSDKSTWIARENRQADVPNNSRRNQHFGLIHGGPESTSISIIDEIVGLTAVQFLVSRVDAFVDNAHWNFTGRCLIWTANLIIKVLSM